MPLLRPGTIGILPAGALGVALYFHLTRELREVDDRVRFFARRGSASGEALRAAARLRVKVGGEIREVAHPALWAPDLLASAEAGALPEVVLVCPQPDQLLGGITVAVQLIEWLHRAGRLGADAAELPVFILCSNGIYFQRVRQFLVEKLEESTLLGRLPDLWPALMPRLVGKFLRGVTIQTGQREGDGAAAVYRPGPPGRTLLAGGDPAVRARCAALLGARGGWFEVAPPSSPTRVEFDKALINLAANLLGQLAAIDDAGDFRLLAVQEIFGNEGSAEARELIERVVEIGRAVGAYTADDDLETIWRETLTSARKVADHIPSSLQWIEQQLRLGQLRPRLTPTETWLLEPLIRYAHAAGLEDAARYFEKLTARVEQRLALAVRRQGKSGSPL